MEANLHRSSRGSKVAEKFLALWEWQHTISKLKGMHPKRGMMWVRSFTMLMSQTYALM